MKPLKRLESEILFNKASRIKNRQQQGGSTAKCPLSSEQESYIYWRLAFNH